MAGSKSDFLENLVINTVLGKSTTLVTASTLYLVLTNTTINDSWLVSDPGEVPLALTPTTSKYSRLKFTNSTAANWTKATTGQVQNKAVFSFTTNASTGWGTVQAFAIVDTTSTSAGNVYYWGDLTSPVTISPGNVVRFSTGTLKVGEL